MKAVSANVFVSLLTTDQQQENQFDRYARRSREITELEIESTSLHRTDVIDHRVLNNNDDVADQRETWTNNCDYLITTLGGLIGLGKY